MNDMNELNIPEVPVATPEAPAPEATPAPASATPDNGSPAASAASPTPSPSDPANPEAEQKFEIKVGGKTEMLTKQEMIDRAQMGSDYRQKTQLLADEKRRWEADRAVVLEAERTKWLKEQQENARREQEQASKDPAVLAMERVQALEASLEDQRLDAVLRDLMAKHQVDEQQFLIEASKAGLRTAADVASRGEEIAKALAESQNGRFESRFKEILSKGEHPELKAAQAKWLADYLAKKGSGPSPVPAGAGTPSAGAPVKRVARTFDEAADIAHEMLTGEAPRG